MYFEYDMIFNEVRVELNIKEWYQLFDSLEFEIVEKRCRELENFDRTSFKKWCDEMAEAL